MFNVEFFLLIMISFLFIVLVLLEKIKKSVIFIINKQEMVKINSNMFNEIRVKAMHSKKLSKII